MQWPKRLAQYVLRGRIQAITVGVLFSVLPLATWIANVIVALVTLRLGPKEGGIVLLWVMLPSVILASAGSPLLWLYSIVGNHLLGYVLALVLYRAASWSLILETLLVLGLSTVMAVHWIVPNIHELWLNQLIQQVSLIKEQFGFQVPAAEFKFFARIITGFQVALLFLGGLWNLWVARWLQASLYNPGQLYPELAIIRLNKWVSAIIVSWVGFSFLGYKLDKPYFVWQNF